MVLGLMLYLGKQYWRTQLFQKYLRGCVTYSFFMIVGSLPFILQNILTHPDTSRRLGLFPVERTRLFFLPGWKPYFITVMALILGFGATKLMSLVASKKDCKFQKSIIWFLSFFCIAGCFALPLSTIILGKTIQPAHFPYRLEHLFSLMSLIYLLYMLTLFPFKHLSTNKLNLKRFNQIVTLGVILLSFSACIRFAKDFSPKETPMLGTHEPDAAATISYRTDFVEVIQRLSEERKKGNRIIGTFDFQIYSWWVSFQDGYAFLPFVSETTLSDSQIEYRLAVFCKLLGMNTENFKTFMNLNYIQYFWQSHFKYQVSKAYTFSPFSDYPHHIQKQIKTTTILDNYGIALSISEEKRLITQFERLNWSENILNLDLIILTNGAFLKQFFPPQDKFELIYSNTTFRIWRCKD
jgi:hypothetical protein